MIGVRHRRRRKEKEKKGYDMWVQDKGDGRMEERGGG